MTQIVQSILQQIHSSAWPNVLKRLRQSHIADYSIHFLPQPPYLALAPDIAGLLIATFKYVGEEFDADMAAIAADPETRRWWALTDPMQSSLIEGAMGGEHGAWWYGCEEVFRME